MTGTTSNLPVGWVRAPIEALGSVQVGLQKSPERDRGHHSTLYLRSANIDSSGLNLKDVSEMDISPIEQERFRLVEGDILIVEGSGSASHVGRSAVWNGELPLCCFQNHLIRFRPHAVESQYAQIVFRFLAESGAFSKGTRGIGIQHMGVGRFKKMVIPVPPENEQVAISEAFKKKESQLAKAKDALLSALKNIEIQTREVLKAVVLVRNDSHLSLSLSNAEIKALALGSETEVGGELDLCPWRSIDSLGLVTLGRQKSQASPHSELKSHYIRAANIRDGYFDLRDVGKMDFSEPERERYTLRRGDILLAEASGSSSQVGRAAMWNDEIPDCCYQNTAIRFRPHSIMPEYALMVFQYYFSIGVFSEVARGVGIQHLGAQRFAKVRVPCPPIEVQRTLVVNAKHQLSLCQTQDLTTKAALARIPILMKELLTSAVSGTLVPQTSSNEPAELLLARRGAPPKLVHLPPNPSMYKVQFRMHQTDGQPKPLLQILREASQAMPAPELLLRAGYDKDSTDDIEQFYLELRRLVGQQAIRVSSHENGLIEAVSHAN